MFVEPRGIYTGRTPLPVHLISDRGRWRLVVPALFRPAHRATLAALALAAVPLVTAPGTGVASAGGVAAMPFDVDGDGTADLVVSATGEDLGAVRDAGAVTVVLAETQGVSSSARNWNQDVPYVKDAAEAGDRFGEALASGDFDRDGYADVAIGVPGESVGSVARAGAVAVLYGSALGLSDRDPLWSQDSAGVIGVSEVDDEWGAALAVGDLDGDGYADLAVGAPHEDIGTAVNGGAVTVLYGSATGLTSTRSSSWNQNTPGIAEAVELWAPVDEDSELYYGADRFGSALAVGDTTGDGRAELVIGVPNESVGTVIGGGGVHLLLGRVGGITAEGSSYWTQNTEGVLDQADQQRDGVDYEPLVGDWFGSALAVGDVDGDGRGDVAIGIPREQASPDSGDGWGGYLQGAVAVLRGDPRGLTATGNQFLHQDSPGVPGLAADAQRFGTAVALGDVTGDRRADLAVGAPGNNTTASRDAALGGTVIVLPGSSAGVGTTGAQSWGQDSAGVPGAAEDEDGFGRHVALLNLGRGGPDDLVVGVPGENDASGLVHVLYSSGTGLTATGTQALSQDSPGIPGASEAGDQFSGVGGP